MVQVLALYLLVVNVREIINYFEPEARCFDPGNIVILLKNLAIKSQNNYNLINRWKVLY